jgi:glycosyltransferase involved in cell wall biosynthesis
VDIRPDVYVYFLLPKNFHYVEEEIINHPRIEKIWVEAFRGQHKDKVLVPSELYKLFNVDTGKYYYDVVICDKSQITSWVKIILENVKDEESRALYVNFAEFIAKKEGRFRGIMDEYEYACTLGWLAGYNVFQNERHAQMCFEIAKKYLQPYWVKKIIENTKIVNLFGVDTERLDKFCQIEKEKRDRVVINYAHRMATHYHPEFVLDVVDKVFSSGENIEFVITTPSAKIATAVGKWIRKMKKRGLKIDLYIGLPQDKFYERARQCDLFISAIEHTETANSIFEQLYLGQVGILPDVDWTNKFLPEYPFKYKFGNVTEAYRWVKEYIKNPDGMRKKIEKYREIIKEKWDIRKESEKVLEWIEELLKRKKVKKAALDLAEYVLEKAGYPNCFSFEEMVKMFKKYSKTKINILRESYLRLNKFDIIKAVKGLGYRDTAEKELKFEKIK